MRFFAFLIFLTLCIAAKLDMGNFSVIPIVLMIIAGTYYLFHQKVLLRDIFFHANVKRSSGLHWLRRRHLFLYLVSILESSVLCIAIFIFAINAHMYALLTLAALQISFEPVRQTIAKSLEPHLKVKSKFFISNLFSIIICGSVTLVLMIAVKYYEFLHIDNHVLASSNDMASYVIGKVNHGFTVFQHIARTLSMFELELLRAKQLSGGIIGNIILIYFLLPSSIAAFGLPIVCAGLQIRFTDHLIDDK